MRGLFADKPVVVQIAVLAAAMAVGFGAAAVITSIVLLIAGNDFTGSAVGLQCLQFVASALTFLLPAVATAWLCSERPMRFLNLRPVVNLRLICWIAAATLLVSPTVSLTGWLNEQMQLPGFLAPVERMMREAEDQAAAMVAKMLSDDGAMSLTINIIVIAAGAAVCEEFLFRGALFGILKRTIRNPHVVVWTVAFIFSAIHLQFYGFLPRLLLGAFLGYLLLWTRTIWAPVMAHFINNAVAVIGLSSDTLKDNAYFADKINGDDLGWFMIVAAVTLAAFAGCMRAIYRSET